MLAAMTCSRPSNLVLIQSSVGCSGRVYIQLSRPRAKKFFERSASRGLTPRSDTDSLVIEVMGTSNTV